MIRFKNVHKSFGDQHVLRGVDLEVPKGSVTAIMGFSGTGKSVLIKILLGLLKADEGSILVEGEDIVGMDVGNLNRIRRKFGMLFQDAALFNDMNVFENVSFPLYEHTDHSDDEIADRVHDKLKEVGLENIDHKLPSELSGGMRKRVGLARALMLDPKILLFDEPTTGLDPIITLQISDLMRETHEHYGVTILMISHDLGLSYRNADQLAMLYEGKIAQTVHPDEFATSSHPFVHEYLGAFKEMEPKTP